jgi:hypothetical protein
VEVDRTIICVDCGETAHLISYPPDEGGWAPGEVVVYRCSGCGDRWDVVLPEDPEDPTDTSEA